MAQQSLKRHPLSEHQLTAGREFLELLDKYGLGVQGAVWIYLGVVKEWRFYIVTSLVKIDGLVDTYNRIEKLFELRFGSRDISIDDIHLGSPDEPMFVALANGLKVVGQSLIELVDVSVNQLEIEHAYIYRLDKVPPVIEAKQARQRFDKNLRQLERAETR